MNIFTDLGLIVILATVFIFIFRLLKQPLIPGYILAGIILGPAFGNFLHSIGLIEGYGVITDLSLIKGISEIGLAFLLFIVGLHISIKKLKDVGHVATIGTIVQFILLGTGGFFLARAFFATMPSFYIGIMMSFGSTMVVINILTKKAELDTLHGRIIIGILLAQDVIAILAITLLSGLASAEGGSAMVLAVLISILKICMLGGAAYCVSVYVFPRLFKIAAKSQELLLMISISTAFVFSILADKIGEIILFFLEIIGFELSVSAVTLISPGLSVAIGAFLGGIALASSPYAFEISSKIAPIKDFFVSIFFVSLGAELVFDNFVLLIPPVIAFLLFLLLVKPTIISVITAFFGYERRTSFITGLSLFQVSEFGLIVMTLGYTTGVIRDAQFFSMTILLAAITMVLTTYVIKYQNVLYEKVGRHMKYLNILTQKNKNLQYMPNSVDKEVVLIGYNRIGFSIFKTLKRLKKNFLILDFNPELIKGLIKSKIHCIYGDANNVETLEKLHFEKAKYVICTIPDYETNALIIKSVRRKNKKTVIFVTSYDSHEALDLYELGADYVILPHFLGGDHVSLLLEDISSDLSTLVRHKFNHIQELEERKKSSHHV